MPKASNEPATEEPPAENRNVEETKNDEVNEVHVENKLEATTTTDDQLTKDFLNGDYCLQGVSFNLIFLFLLLLPCTSHCIRHNILKSLPHIYRIH